VFFEKEDLVPPNFRNKQKDERTQIGQTTTCAATFETKRHFFSEKLKYVLEKKEKIFAKYTLYY
jgi:hypothetical protein